MSKRILWLLPLLASAAAVLAAGAGPRAKLPGYVRLRLAGGNIEEEADYVKYDPGERYYLVASGDCDGAHIYLVLTPDPRPWGYHPESRPSPGRAQRVTLPRLHDGAGVNIGETPEQVRRKLSAKPEKEAYNRRTGERVWTYVYPKLIENGPRGPRERAYGAEYTFRQDRLWSIFYHLDSGGCP